MSEALSPRMFWFGVCTSPYFVGSESGQIQNVKLFKNLVSNRTPPNPSQPYSVCIYCTLTQGEGGEGES